MKIAVLGAGAWGTALAIAARRQGGHSVRLWARDAAQAQAMQAARENLRYLPGIGLPEGLEVLSGAFQPIAANSDLVVLATPMAGLRSMLLALRDLAAPVVWLCKGVEASASGTGLLPHEVCAAVAPRLRAAVLSGPSFAQEVAREKPTALVAGSADIALRELLVQAFHGKALRVYANDDVVGIEVGGAVKNVMAIATGLCDGLQLGLNARAALVTRGLVEMTRLGLALGARAETFHGLSGLGDLVLTSTGDLSRNRKVGLLLAQGMDQQQAVASLGHVAEGVYCARTVVERARALGVEMPIAESVVALLDGRMQPVEAVAALMERQPVAESD
ncbi:NAD(P)H-dependent glycerol-3-phosphate dehydrogenase [Xylophilus rhododendri]|uniref:Glycerol-3-phosphate dehydrogenase [NAD(P)+] n=1 Tax=Xylophilus rhododendri TaxID=2697032 RepID=A0A857J9K6_9BURK|nr:NAD(P)H-dependent glycerol-3-phosphate dehydrogenase [Xylophilus rhododendri]QHI99435.1 NAD(P)H-dependent glycerol-3-phosphate dehydrogenase [Xylophilus rhododendri]